MKNNEKPRAEICSKSEEWRRGGGLCPVEKAMGTISSKDIGKDDIDDFDVLESVLIVLANPKG